MAVQPKFRLLGLVKPWNPGPPRVYREGLHLSTGCGVATEIQDTFGRPAVGIIDPSWRGEVESETIRFARAGRREETEHGERTGSRGSSSLSVPLNTEKSNLEQVLLAILQPPLQDLTQPGRILDWPAALLPYQLVGVETLIGKPKVLLADDMGLGKTIQVLAALRILFCRGEIQRALVVAPASLLRNWARETSRWAPELMVRIVSAPSQERAALWRWPAHIYIVSYETLREDVSPTHVTPATENVWDVVILDEASKIKNRESRAAQATKLLPRIRAWALTGTPIENRVDDVHSILEFLLGDRDKPVALSPGRERLRELLGELLLRRKKSEVLAELPPKTVETLLLSLSPSQQEAYDRAEREGVVQLRKLGGTITITHVLELITRLKQICNIDPVSGDSAKLDDIKTRLETLCDEGHRALVFTQFTDASFGVEMVRGQLAKYDPLIYTGAMSMAAKAAAETAFQSRAKHKVLILSLRAGGLGLNLQSASFVFHLDRWWNPAIEDQAEARAHRMGQLLPVTVYRYVCANTIEERIERILEEKRAIFSNVIDDESLDITRTLTRSEIFGLFGLEVKGAGPARLRHPTFGQLSGAEFELWLAERLRILGFDVIKTGGPHDGGIDIVAVRPDELGLEHRLLVQCKNLSEPASVSVVRELLGSAPDRATGTTLVLACPAGFSADAEALAGERSVKLWDAAVLERLAPDGGTPDTPKPAPS